MRLLNESIRIAYDCVTLGGNRYLRSGFLRSERDRGLFQAGLSRLGVAAVGVAPNAMLNFVVRNYRASGLHILGLGYHSVVVADGDWRVRKIHHRTLHIGSSDRQAYIDRLHRKQDVLCDHFPEEMIARQVFTVEPFPLNPELTTVVSKQERVTGKPLDYGDALEDPEVVRLCKDMLDNAGALPDIAGKSNILTSDAHSSRKIIVDTIPVEACDPTDYEAFRVAQDILHVQNARVSASR